MSMTPPPPPPPPGFPPPPPPGFPPPPPSGPMPGPGYSGGGAPQNGSGVAALVLGILGFVCLGPFGSIPALILGRAGMARADQGLANNRGMAQAGFILGLVGTILFALAFVGWIIAFIVAASQGA